MSNDTTSREPGARGSPASQFSRAVARERVTTAILAAVLSIGLVANGPAAARDSARDNVHSEARPESINLVPEPNSSDARQMFDWVLRTGDNRGMPFVIVDKKDARVLVFDGGGQLLGSSSALLGLARGDDSAPGIGDRKLSDIRPQERTTPAGRFVASLGYGLGKQDILWVDYNTALALHRVLAANTREHRLERLATGSPLSHRITFGCINVPANFYDAVVRPAFTGTSGVVYILPEVKTLSEVFFGSAS